MPLKIPTGKILAFDVESTGLHTRLGDRPFALAFANFKQETGNTFWRVDPATRRVTYPKAEIEAVQALFERSSLVVWAHNAQFDKRMIEAAVSDHLGRPWRTQCQWRCSMALIRTVKSSARLALKPFCKEYLGIPDDDETALRTEVARQRGLYKQLGAKLADALEADYWMVPDLCQKYNLWDALRVVAVVQTLFPEVNTLNLKQTWTREVKLWPIMREIEDAGVHVDREKALALRDDFKKKHTLYDLKARCYTGLNFNLASPIQLKKKFYDDLNEPVLYLTEKSKQPATDYAALKAMKHPLARYILEMRACNKTVEFMEQYLKFMVRHDDGEWYIHPSLSQSNPTTGRESCFFPNLQQATSGESAKEGVEVKAEVRSVFTPRPGYAMRSYDWKNIEVFIPAFASGEPALTQVLLDGGDTHRLTASKVFKVAYVDVTERQRFIAKRVFFGLQYGIGLKKLCKLLEVTPDEGEDIVYQFQNEYPVLWEWMDALKARATTEGCVVTPFGRRIDVAGDAVYRCINYYVQGTAADILKQSKIRIYDEIKRRRLRMYMVLPIHDEILPYIKKGFPLDEADELMVRNMQHNPELRMPIAIPVSISAIETNWHAKVKVRVAA